MKGSPFKLRSPLQVEGGLGTLTDTSKAGQTVTYAAETTKKDDKILNTVDKTTQGVQNGDNGTGIAEVTTNLANTEVNSLSSGNSVFDRDGRSVDKFDQRIADAESKGKLGRVQRLKNRKGGYMESQANKLEKAGGTLTNDQKIALNKAGEESGGTKAGKGLRAFFGRDAKQRKVDPVPVKKDDEDKDNSNNEFGNGFGPS